MFVGGDCTLVPKRRWYQSLGIKATSQYDHCSLKYSTLKIQKLDLKMLRFIFLIIMSFTILVADVEGRATRNRRFNLLKKYHRSQKAAHFGSEPKKRFLRQTMAKMLIQRRNFANKLFFWYFHFHLTNKYPCRIPLYFPRALIDPLQADYVIWSKK